MPYEIDYISVGEGERSGDAIAMRFGNLNGTRDEQIIIVIDGGFKESGERLVEFIQHYYGNTDRIDLVISTHPDADHSLGLIAVLEKMKVNTLLMHKPWEYAEVIENLFKDGRITASGLEDRIEKSLQQAKDLEALALKQGTQIVEPFQGLTGYNGIMHILGPSQDYYKNLIPLFRSTPEPIKTLDYLAPVRRITKDTINWISDHIGIDLLNDDEDTTPAENNASTIILFNIDGHKLLFTGDAGKTALLQAIDYAKSQGTELNDLNFLDVPHHGSKRNLSSKILKFIKAGVAFISAAKESPKHPAKKITNALQKNGTKVFVTRENGLCHHYQGTDRGWVAAQEEPFHDLVEE